MNFKVSFSARDFSTPIAIGLNPEVTSLTWCAQGGPERAILRLCGSLEKLLDLTRLLRCPVTVSDENFEPVWWGFVAKITLFFEDVTFSVDIDQLYNHVTVAYTALAQPGTASETLTTEPVEDKPSQGMYGVKQAILTRKDVDGNFAQFLAETFLAECAWPKSALSQANSTAQPTAILTCSGWFETLGWSNFTFPYGYLANTDGPGSFQFDDSSIRRKPGQVFYAAEDLALQSAAFLLSRTNADTRTLTATLYATDLTGKPATPLATSGSVPATEVPEGAYAWVTFSFDPPVSLAAGEHYFVGVDANLVHSSHYFHIKIDEEAHYVDGKAYYQSSTTPAWSLIPSSIYPYQPDVYFKLGFVCDSADLLATAVGFGDQFFTQVGVAPTAIAICPYRAKPVNCLAEVKRLMALGTTNGRRLLADLSADRGLRFYEQPDPREPAVFVDAQCRMFTMDGTPIPPWSPPVGKFARLMTARITDPFDDQRLPATFIERVSYFPQTGRVRINPRGSP